MSKDSLTENKTPVRHQLCSLLGLGHVTARNPSSVLIVIAIMWLETRFAINTVSFRIVDHGFEMKPDEPDSLVEKVLTETIKRLVLFTGKQNILYARGQGVTFCLSLGV